MIRRTIYDRPLIDWRFETEALGLRWVLVALYAVFEVTGVIKVDLGWFMVSLGYLVTFHLFYTWRTWYELRHHALPDAANQVTPFLDTLAVSLALIAVGDPLHPIWAVYFFVILGVGFYYHTVAGFYLGWLLSSYLLVAVVLQVRGFDVPAPTMGVAAVVLSMAVANVAIYTRGERRLRDRVSVTARTDPLTGLLNRRGLEEMLAQQLAIAAASERGLSVFMIDIDYFKRLNDQYGHLAADDVLEQLAELLTEAVRAPDLVGRYGGDEFVIVVPEVDADEAIQLAERVRVQVERSGLCTVSIGVTATTDERREPNALLELADIALLRAKRAGRNRVHGATPSQAAA